MSTWEEAKHPRSKNGEFGHGDWVKKLSDKMDKVLEGDEAYNSVPASHEISKGNNKPVDFYSGKGYKAINGAERHGIDTIDVMSRPTIQRYSNELSAIIDNAPPLKQGIKVERGTGAASDMFGPVGSRIGKTFTDKGFVSSTTDTDTIGTFARGTDKAHITIHIPAGSKVMRVEPEPGDDYEKEILMQRGSQFKIISDVMATVYGRQVRQLELELLA